MGKMSNDFFNTIISFYIFLPITSYQRSYVQGCKSHNGQHHTKEAVCKVARAVMVNDSEVGQMVRTNHAKWREFLLARGWKTLMWAI